MQVPFRHTPLSRVGSWLHWLLGESSTVIKEGPAKTRVITIPTDGSNLWPSAEVTCVRVVYSTRYHRWLVPPIHRTLYTVTIDVPASLKARYPDELFAPFSFPLLCTTWLQWTTYPHLCAIHAYLDMLLLKLRQYRLRNGDFTP